jgi:hypothetical protein
MAGIVYPPRTPESIRALLAEFGIVILFTYVGWRFNWHLRGMPGREDGPLPKSTWLIVALSMLGIFLFLAFICGAQRKQMGLSIF